MKTRIIVDSTADLMPELKQRVHLVPLTLRFGEEEYIDGVTINHKQFYKKLMECDVLPTTSQGTPHAFAQEYEKAKEAGESAVVITVSSRVSGTYQSAVIAAEEYENLYIVDSGTGTVGHGILVELALQLLDVGLSAKEIAERLEEEKKKIVLVALVDTLKYLQKGGRISKTIAFTGKILHIKPVLSAVDGVIQMVGKARGLKRGYHQLIQQMEDAGGVDFSKPVLLGYSGISDEPVLQFIEDSRAVWQEKLEHIKYTTIGSVIGTHAGPGAIAVAFFKKN